MTRTSTAVQKCIDEFEMTSDELREYVLRQKPAYDAIQVKHTDFTGWLMLKLTCSRRAAESIWKWANANDERKDKR